MKHQVTPNFPLFAFWNVLSDAAFDAEFNGVLGFPIGLTNMLQNCKKWFISRHPSPHVTFHNFRLFALWKVPFKSEFDAQSNGDLCFPIPQREQKSNRSRFTYCITLILTNSYFYGAGCLAGKSTYLCFSGEELARLNCDSMSIGENRVNRIVSFV